jgi:predicted nucleotidyltransferase
VGQIRSTNERFEPLLATLLSAVRARYAERLVSVAIFGSVGRGTPRPGSDVDVLIVADDLPSGRVARMDEFSKVEQDLAPALATARRAGLAPEISVVIKSREEAAAGSMLMLDMIDDARVLYDRDDFLRGALESLRVRLERLGARRIWRGDTWHWDLKPDLRPGEIFEL